jgi:glycosyltransferase involved in cell wall biosynthesis
MTVKEVCPTGLKWLPTGGLCDVRAGVACLTNGCVTVTGFAPLMLQRSLWHRNQRAFRAIVCCSQDVRSRLERDGIATHGVVAPGVHESAPRPPLAGPPTISFAGRLKPEKGADVLLRAFALARQRIPDARLAIAGSGSAEPALRALVGDLGVGDAVVLHGQLGGAALDDMLDRAWVHAVPSCWPEPFGLTATEAMMRGTAVVASEVGGLADLVFHERTGLRVPPADVPALADALVRVLSDRDWAEALGRAGRAHAREHFSLDTCLTRLERVYEQLRIPTPRPAHAH